ncbi:MAG: hypothetical protein DRN90_03230 [Thermoproteota archaeon]|nr:MAG: hypothetical protein DRN90_03230 [Candidatus Korarchaeota archaeon]
MSSYKKGYGLEYSVKRFLEERGIPVIRFAGSKPADLFFRIGDEKFIAECKNITKREESTLYLPEDEVNKLAELATLFDARPIVIFSFYRQKPRVIELKDLVKARRSFRVGRDDGILLETFIEGEMKDD